MGPENISWSDLSVGLAAIAANVYIVTLFLRFLGNHLSHLNKGIEELTVATEILAKAVQEKDDEIRRLDFDVRRLMAGIGAISKIDG